MIPRIHQAEKLKDDLWLVYFVDPDEPRFPIMRIVPVDENPVSCPGGELWCKQFGCVPGDNVFTRAKTEILVQGEDGEFVNSGLTLEEILENQDELAEYFEGLE